MHMKFIYSPAGIWGTTRSRSSRQGYFQISFPCKHCKWTKHHFFVYYFIWLISKDPKTSFGTCGLVGVVGRVVSSRLITYDLTSFFSFLFFNLKHLTAPLPRPQRKLLRLQPYDPTNRNPPGKDIEVVDAVSKLSTESHEPIPEMNVQTHVVFPQLVIKCCKRSKNRANLEAKLGALKEMISEGWLTHIQQHLTLLKPNWPFRDQIASEDRILTKSPPSYHSYDSAEIYFRQTPQTTQSNKENQAKSQHLYWRRLVPWHRSYHKSMQ